MKRKDDILKLRKEGYSYRQIAIKLNCSRGIISYHLGDGQKEKYKQRQKNFRETSHPLVAKIYTFCEVDSKIKKYRSSINNLKLSIYKKIHRFCMEGESNMKLESKKTNFTVEELLEKIGDNPKCYLTGRTIDLTQSISYHLDHKIPRSRGGSNTLENAEIATKQANQAKNDLTVEEFIQLCKDTLTNFGYKIGYEGIEP